MLPTSGTASLLGVGGCLLLLATAEPICAQIDVYPADARSDGMGAAFTAVAEGPGAGWWNPGALAFGPGISVLPLSYIDLSPEYVGIRFPAVGGFPDLHHRRSLWTSAGALRAGFVGAGLVYQELEDKLEPEPPAIAGHTRRFRAVRAGAGIDVLRRVLPDQDRFRWGLGSNVKWFETENQDASVPDGARSSTYDADFGTVFSYRRRDTTPRSSPGSPPEEVAVRAGVVLLNAFDRELETPDNWTQPLGRAWRAGLAAEIAGGGWTAHGPWVRVLLAMDWLYHFGRVQDEHASFNVGGELRLLDLVALRAGGQGGYWDGACYGFGVDSGNRLGRLGLQCDFADIPGLQGFRHFDAALRWSL